MGVPWGVTYDGGVWLSDPEALIDAHFTTAGERTGEFSVADIFGVWGADMAFDTERNLIWQVNVGGDNGIYGLDPADGSVEQVITGSPWDDISQRGLAYDPNADVFYIGGWNEGIVYKVAGPSHPTPGETLNECSPPDQGISGLAWNGSFGMLWESTNSETDTIWLHRSDDLRGQRRASRIPTAVAATAPDSSSMPSATCGRWDRARAMPI